VIPLDVRLRNFVGAVAFASDEAKQRLVWVDKARGLTSIVSVGEFYCQFFDDNDMEGFIKEELNSAPLTQAQREAILALRAALEPVTHLASYRDNNDQRTLESAEWNAVIQCAKHALSVFVP